MNTLILLADTATAATTTVAGLVPMDINIDPNDSGLPGLDHLRDRVGLRRQLLQPPPGGPGEGRRPRLLRRRRHLRRVGDVDQLLLGRRPAGLTHLLTQPLKE